MEAKSQVAFIVLNDGPCGCFSFRPNEDGNQWWSRRDALVRIIRAACWQSNQQPNDTVHSLNILFHTSPDKESKGKTSNVAGEVDIIGVSSIFPNKVCVPGVVPMETTIIQALRSSFQEAEQESKGHNSHRGGSLVMQVDSKVFRYNETSRTSSYPTHGTPSSNLSKKDMVHFMQQGTDIDFLRKYKLNGSIELVLKKVNKDDIQAAYSAYQQAQLAGSGKESTKRTENAGYKKSLESSILQIFNSILSESKKRKREETTPSSAPAGADTIVLFLHEDYPQELPIFLNNSIPELQKSLPFKKVVCVLGGVRDIYPIEVDTILQVARQLHLPVLGANLGKVAEFTSKIIISMVYHSKNARLFDAVAHLWRQEQQQKEAHADASNSESLDITLHSIYSTNNAVNGRGIVAPHNPQEIVLSNSTKDHLIVVASLPMLFTQVSLVLEHRAQHVDLIQLLVATLWRSRIVHHTSVDSVARHSTHSDIVLIDSDLNVFQISQHTIVELITLYHIAAPSEYQVLDMVVKLVQQHVETDKDDDASVRHDNNGASENCFFKSNANRQAASVDQVLQDILPEIYSALKSSTEVRLVNCYDASFMGSCRKCDSLTDNFVDSIYDRASLGSGVRDDDLYIIACFASLLSPLSILYRWRYCKPLPEQYASQHQEYVASDPSQDSKKYHKRVNKLSKQIKNLSLHTLSTQQVQEAKGGMSREIWPASTLVTMLQHWSYHNRLRPRLSVKSSETSDT
ncbi:hypothetical protein EON65_29240 [archaeon]|nr:MAG: hypothetical protein EON65_29240 [archaeon]